MSGAGEGEAARGRVAHIEPPKRRLAKGEGEQPRDKGREEPEGSGLDAL